MNEEKKYFGMTRMQIGIIAGLVAALFLIVCLGGFFIFRGGGVGLAGNSVPTPVPSVTSIVPTPATLVPTITPTPIPYEQLIPPDWKQYKTSLIEIWMPGNFKVGDKSLIDTSSGTAILELVVVEVASKSSAYNMIMAVSYEPLVGNTLDEFLNVELPKIPYQARLVDRQTVYINTVEAKRLVFEARVNNIDTNQVIYVFLDGGTVWYIQYAAEIVEYFNNLELFEQSVKTFRVVR